MDHLVQAAVDAGYGTVLVYRGIDDIERAQAVRRGVYRCSRHRGIAADAGTVALADGEDVMGLRRESDGTYSLSYRVWTKQQARKSHLQRHGSDRSAWPYDPRKPATDEERAGWSNRNELGEPVHHD